MRGWIVTVAMLAACKGSKGPADKAPKTSLVVPTVSVATVLAKETPAPPALLFVDDSDNVRLAAAATWADLDAKKLTIAKRPGPLEELDKYIREAFGLGRTPLDAVKDWDKNGNQPQDLTALEDTHSANQDDPPPPPPEDDPTDNDESGGTGTAMALDEGKMGKKDSDRAEGQYRMKKYEDDPQLARQQAIDAAKNAGILGARSLGGGHGAFASLTGESDHHLNEDGTPSRQSDIEGSVTPDGTPRRIRTLIMIAPTAKATRLIAVIGETGGAIAVSQNGKVRPLNLDFDVRDSEWSESDHWREVRVSTKGLVIEAVPDKPLEVSKPEEIATALKTASDARGSDPDAPVDVLVDPDVDVQRMIDVIVALEVAGVHSIGAGSMPSSDEMARRGRRIPTMAIGQPNTQGDLDKKQIRKVVKGSVDKIKACYEKALVDQPALRGTVLTQFFIRPDGTVADSATASGVDPAVSDCLAGVMKTLVFPKPKGGGGVQVNYPFTFRP